MLTKAFMCLCACIILNWCVLQALAMSTAGDGGGDAMDTNDTVCGVCVDMVCYMFALLDTILTV